MYVVYVCTMRKLSLAVATEVKELLVISKMLSICMITDKLQVTIGTLRVLFIGINITVWGWKHKKFHELFGNVVL